ncbi:MAG: hypothetical protein ACR2OH_07975 [Microthrixaceae bacterium]
MTAPTNPFQNRRWMNQSQPRWLQYATWLLYWSALWSFIYLFDSNLRIAGAGLLGIVAFVLAVAQIPLAVFGASEMAMYKKRGYPMALAAAFIPAAIRLLSGLGALGAVSAIPGGEITEIGIFDVIRYTVFPVGGSLSSIISFAFEVALIVFLLHPDSRRYAKLWINE